MVEAHKGRYNVTYIPRCPLQQTVTLLEPQDLESTFSAGAGRSRRA